MGDETVPFQVLQASEQGGIVKVSVNIGKVDQKKLQVWVNGSLQTSRQLVFCKAKEKSEKSNRVCNLSALSSSEIVKAVQSKSAQRHELLESISASRMFRFEGFPETDIRKFIDLALYDVSRLKS